MKTNTTVIVKPKVDDTSSVANENDKGKYYLHTLVYDLLGKVKHNYDFIDNDPWLNYIAFKIIVLLDVLAKSMGSLAQITGYHRNHSK